jgi:hypothetical protein
MLSLICAAIRAALVLPAGIYVDGFEHYLLIAGFELNRRMKGGRGQAGECGV